MSTCVMCYGTFNSHTSYGLCPECWTKDRLREWDRLQSAYQYAERNNVAASLGLPEWLTILNDFNGKCAYCQVQWYGYLEMVDERAGVVEGNVVPICRACQEHKRSSWEAAVKRVQAYLSKTTNLVASSL